MDLNKYQWVYVGKDHPGATSSGYIHAHRHAMELSLGRPLLRGESVHHLDGDKANNDITNLMLCYTESDHQRLFHSESAQLFGKRPKLEQRKFTEAQVKEIEQKIFEGGRSYRSIAREYGTTHNLIGQIARGEYKGVPCG